MPLIKYADKKLSADKRAMIARVNEIIAELGAQGYALSLRQVYYQLVSRDLLPNTQRDYKRLGDIISDGRRAGLIDWEAIEDRTRNLRVPTTWDNPAAIIRACASQYRIDVWAGQPYRPYVLIEKDALVGVLEVACRPQRVPYLSCRGYTSDSEIWSLAQRLSRVAASRISGDYHPREHFGRQQPYVFHLGDHDPSGVDMTRDIRDRLSMFANTEVGVRRLALNMDQVQQYNPPPNPAKSSDARFAGYQAAYGDESWELDALNPTTITAIVRDAVAGLIDPDAWAAWEAAEAEQRARLEAVSRRWDDVTDFLA